MQKKIKKVLIIISIVIICLGIIIGLGVSKEVERSIFNEKIYVDGSDTSSMFDLIGIMGSKVLGILCVIYSIFIDLIIWLIYGIVLIVIKIIKKIKNKV